jgi:oligopeptide transport system permease protein
MTQYIIRRFLGLIPTLFVIITLSFFIIRIAPGGPFSEERALPKQILENIQKRYHLDEPLLMQYGRYVADVVRGDLGPSFRYKDYDVNYYIRTSLPNSMVLGLVSLALALFFGISAGLISSTRQNSALDYLSMSVAVIGISVPLFVVGPVLMYLLAMKLNLLPTSGWIMSGDSWKTMIMPVMTLTLPYFAYIARLSRASILEVLRSDYVRTARAKGVSEPTILFKHVMKGSLLPVVSYLGPAFAHIVTGSIVVETIFRVPGLGRHFIQSALNRDYTLIMGTVIVYSLILLLMNFMVDLLYGLMDPRISYR